MDIKFVGGPLDGEVHEIDLEPAADRVIYWPPQREGEPMPNDDLGLKDVFEYLWRGEGALEADYVGGFPSSERNDGKAHEQTTQEDEVQGLRAS